jgi:hypothetical protein
MELVRGDTDDHVFGAATQVRGDRPVEQHGTPRMERLTLM